MTPDEITDLIARLVGVADFYESIPNMSNRFCNVGGIDGDFHLTTEDLRFLAGYLENP